MRGERRFSSRGNRGAALLIVVMTVVLTMALFVMAITNSMIGHVVTRNHLQGRTSAQCSQGYLSVAHNVLVQTSQLGSAAINTLPTGITIDRTMDHPDIANGLGGEEPTLNDFIEEVGRNNALAVDDLVVGTNGNGIPDITIAPGFVNGCGAADIDIDFLFHDVAPGEEAGSLVAYHNATGGVACGEGDFYSVTVVMRQNDAGSSPVRSAYFKC